MLSCFGFFVLLFLIHFIGIYSLGRYYFARFYHTDVRGIVQEILEQPMQ